METGFNSFDSFVANASFLLRNSIPKNKGTPRIKSQVLLIQKGLSFTVCQNFVQ